MRLSVSIALKALIRLFERTHLVYPARPLYSHFKLNIHRVGMSKALRAPTIADTVCDLGFIAIPSWRPQVSTLEIARSLGSVAELPSVRSVQTLAPQNVEQASHGTYSGNFGLDRFPLHTDLAHWSAPPRFLLLRSLVGHPQVVTTLVDSSHVAVEFDTSALRRVLWLPRRPVGLRRTLLRMFDAPGGVQRFRWDRLFLRPATSESKSVITAVNELLHRVPPRTLTLANAGDTLILDNWRYLHGRSRVPMAALSRRIQRVYLHTLLQ